ncbi:hypothetical protein ACLKA6_013662 [Drosophila palustris]
MLKTIICTIFTLSTLNFLSEAIPISEYNETKRFSREELELQRILIDGLAKKTDILDLQERINGLMNTMDRQGKLIDTQGKLIDTQGKLIDGVVKTPRIHNCAEAKSSGNHDIILPSFSSEPFTVVCDAETRNGGGWTIILRRMDGSINFYRNWTAYKNGFGDLNGEFFLGWTKYML